MDALMEVHNDETHLQDDGLLRGFLVLAAHSLVAHPTAPVPPDSPPVCLLHMVRVPVFIVITVIDMDMWRPFAIKRRKLRRLRLTILHRVMMVLVLVDPSGVLLVQRHKSCSCYFIALQPLCCQELLVL
jgi:hypothetical protein